MSADTTTEDPFGLQRFVVPRRRVGPARAYLAHPVLGPRLRECTAALLATDPSLSAERILGDIDALKLHSSMTLFARGAPGDDLFQATLDRFYEGETDPETDRRL